VAPLLRARPEGRSAAVPQPNLLGLIKHLTSGELTYFASDTAYYVDKRERGFDRCIYLLGADHHGYVGRLRALAALDAPVSGINLRIPFLDYQPGQPVWLTGGTFGPEGGVLATLILGLATIVAGRFFFGRNAEQSTGLEAK